MAVLRIRNPHSVLAALEARPRDVQQIIIPPALAEREGRDRGGSSEPAPGRDAWLKVAQIAREKGVAVSAAAPQAKGGGKPGGHHGGRNQSHGGGRPDRNDRPDRGGDREEQGRLGVAEALIQERPGLSPEELFRGAADRVEGKGLWLALDSLTDPHNVGAIFRTASFFGVQGILLTQERSAPLTAAVYDVASGGLEDVPFATVTNLQRAFEVAKEAGLWILGTSERAKQGFATVERDRPWLLVLGNEEKGMRRLTEESCDVVCQVPPVSGATVTSLNVSVAAGVLMARLSG
jgi:23S rRNA (guanosine2251-2'-O)-methyltransferase